MFSDKLQIQAARRILEHLGSRLDIPFSVRLWDGSMIPLGQEAGDERYFSLSGPGVLGSLLRRPSLDTLFRHYVKGHIELHGSDLVDSLDFARSIAKRSKFRLAHLRKGFPWPAALPLLLTSQDQSAVGHEYHGDESGRIQEKRDNLEFIQFHYDASNAFYALFLDPEMVYSCAYFNDWSNGLEQAQRDKLDLVCRKLRLKAGETFLDIGCGWGGLICHAAVHYGVRAHGATLSQAQYDYTTAKIKRLNLQDRVTVSLCDYRTLQGRYDKIASIGMYEHVGIANYPAYFRSIHSLLDDRGVFLNHGITRRAKRKIHRFSKISAGRRVILKYIFPGSELDHIGHTLQIMEAYGFDVHDVEGLRPHYARTCRLWYDRLVKQREAAIAEVGAEQYRMWLAYLAGVTGAFGQGPLRVFQVLATKQPSTTISPLPPTREDIYSSPVQNSS